MEIGDKIKKYRKARGLSQFELEIQANMSNGSISRIENGQTNPTKETLADISLALQLNSREIADLYGIKTYNSAEIIRSTSKLLKTSSLSELVDHVVNDMIFKIGFVASAFFIVEDNFIITYGITKTNISEITFSLIKDIPLHEIKWEITKDNPSALVKSYLLGKPLIVSKDSDYLYPAISKNIADEIQERTGDDKTYILPIKSNSRISAVLVIASKVHTDFSKDEDVFQSIGEQIGIALEKILL